MTTERPASSDPHRHTHSNDTQDRQIRRERGFPPSCVGGGDKPRSLTTARRCGLDFLSGERSRSTVGSISRLHIRFGHLGKLLQRVHHPWSQAEPDPNRSTGQRGLPNSSFGRWGVRCPCHGLSLTAHLRCLKIRSCCSRTTMFPHRDRTRRHQNHSKTHQ
ncbi:hypothetical protein RHOER0001_6622 [Rhodococcus erythropolis SK121]|nr:hypothetical protein RHOER0001_6622 [Rhodococcus erythropolis SK121]